MADNIALLQRAQEAFKNKEFGKAEKALEAALKHSKRGEYNMNILLGNAEMRSFHFGVFNYTDPMKAIDQVSSTKTWRMFRDKMLLSLLYASVIHNEDGWKSPLEGTMAMGHQVAFYTDPSRVDALLMEAFASIFINIYSFSHLEEISRGPFDTYFYQLDDCRKKYLKNAIARSKKQKRNDWLAFALYAYGLSLEATADGQSINRLGKPIKCYEDALECYKKALKIKLSHPLDFAEERKKAVEQKIANEKNNQEKLNQEFNDAKAADNEDSIKEYLAKITADKTKLWNIPQLTLLPLLKYQDTGEYLAKPAEYKKKRPCKCVFPLKPSDMDFFEIEKWI